MSEPPRSYFDDTPALYDRARPQYPAALFDDLFAFLAAGRPTAAPAIFEVGPGTGQATGALLARGARVTAIELGANLAAFLAEKHRGNPALTVLTGAFETAPVEGTRWDAIVSATAYHWIDPAVRMTRPAALLAPGGVLAVIDTNQVRAAVDRGFFDRSFPIYRKYRPDERADPGRPADLVPPIVAEMEGCGRFEEVRLWRYRWDQRYDAAAYEDLLRSYSDMQRMEPTAREGLIGELRAMVAAEPGGAVVRPLVITLAVARQPR